MQQTRSTKISAATTMLMQALRFDQRDLAKNREGQLSQRQIARLQPPRVQGLALWVLLGHVAVIVAILGAIAIISQHWGFLLVALIATGMAGMPIMMVRDQRFMQPAINADVQNGVVKAICGPTTRHTQADKRRSYQITIDETTFEVSSKVYSGFFQESEYCIYYLPRSRVIVSAEQIV